MAQDIEARRLLILERTKRKPSPLFLDLNYHLLTLSNSQRASLSSTFPTCQTAAAAATASDQMESTDTKTSKKSEVVSEQDLKHTAKTAVAECPSCGYEDLTRVKKEGSALTK